MAFDSRIKKMTTLRARFDGRVLIPETPVNLPTGSVLELTVVEAGTAEAPAGNLEKLKMWLRKPPSVTEEDIRALEAAINSGRQNVRVSGPFDIE